MNGITHKQAQRYLRMDLDGLLTEGQRLDLETHLRDCETCRADSESLSTLTRRLQTQFHSRWDLRQDGPSKQVLANIHSQSRRIRMQKRIDFAFNIFGGMLTLLILLFVVSSVVSQLQKKSTTADGNQTNLPASAPKEERLLAFTSRQSGNSEIYTIRSDGSDLRNITNHSASDMNPAWSPDGKRIAFQSDRSSGGFYSQIFLMDADGSNVTLLTTDEGNHQLPLNSYSSNTNPWSPDGSKLLFLRQGLTEGEWILQSIDINTGNITSLATGRVSFSDISWSPDGKYIWFFLNDPQNTDLGNFVSQIHIVSADGTNLINIGSLLPPDETLVPPYNYYWSRDGKTISFSTWVAPDNTASENYTSKLYKVGIDGSLTLQATARSPIASVWGGIYFISPLGAGNWTWVYPDSSINSINPTQECEQERLYDSSTNSYTSAVASFSRSPNGNGVIIASCPDGNIHLSWINAAGTEITPIVKLSTAPAVGYMDWVQWSQDDKFIAFHLTASDATDVYLVDVTESPKDPSIPPVKISLRLEFPFLPAWQPVSNVEIAEIEPAPEPVKTFSSDDLIAFTAVNNDASNTNMDIYTIRTDGSNLTNLTHDSARDFNANDYEPVWSPDRNKIAFISDRGGNTTGNTNIFVMNPDGSDLTQLTYNPGYDTFLAWSLNGEQIVYFSSPTAESNAQGQLIVMNTDGTNKIVLTPPGYYYFQGWSPDNQKIIYVEPRFDGTSYRDAGIHLVDLEGKNGPEWFVDNIDLIHWEDTEHFLGVVRTQAKWSLYRFGVDGSQVELASQSGQIVSIFESAYYVVERQGELMWYRLEDSATPLNAWDPAEKCKAKGGLYQSTGLSWSPDQKHALAIIHCAEATWYFLVNEDGSEIEQLGSPTDASSGVFPQWSPDGKYVSLFFLNKKGAHGEYLSLIDIERMLNDPAASPIPLTTNAVIGFGTSEPLISASNEATEKPTPEPLDFSLTVYQAEKLAFFDVLEPAYLPAGYTLEGVAYDPWAQEVAMKYVSSRGNGSLFIYQQRGDWLHHSDSRAYATPAPIGNMNGEFIQGAWIYESPDTTTPTWDPRAEAHGLSWQNGEFVFSIDFIGGEGITPLPFDEFVSIAESLK